MLNFILKKNWYEKIKSGEKTIEYREVKPYWTKRICSELSKEFERRFGRHCEIEVSCSDSWNGGHFVLCEKDAKLKCKLRLGYTKNYMSAKITKIEIVDGKNTDLNIDKPVYAIQLSDVQEIKMHMTDEEKGYHCPHDPKKGIDCFNCPFQALKCIVYSATGRKKLREWKKKNNIPSWK